MGIDLGTNAGRLALKDVVKDAYEANEDTNVFTDADKEKLDIMAASSTALDLDTLDGRVTTNEEKIVALEIAESTLSGSEVKTLYEAENDTNAFTDAEKTKLAGTLGGGATAQSGAEIKVLYEAEADTNVFSDTDKVKLAGIEVGATVGGSTTLTGAEIATLYEGQADTNKYTDSAKTKTDNLTITQPVNLDTLESNQAAISSGMSANQNNITTLQTDVVSAKSNITALQETSAGLAVVKVDASRTLTVGEVSNTLITNYGQGDLLSLQLPVMNETALCRAFVESDAGSFYLAPPRGLHLILDGTQLGKNKRVLCSTGIGSSLIIACLQHADGEFYWHIYTSWGTFLEASADPQVISVLESPQWLWPKESWSFLDTGADLGTSWRETAFDHSAWAEGMGPLGFGEADIETELTAGQITYYFRKVFFVYGDTDQIVSMAVDTGYDDGMAVFINGTEVYRINLPEDGSCAFDTPATAGTEGGVKNHFTVPASALVDGKNVIAVELHNNSADSSDVYLQLTMSDERTKLRKGPYLMLSGGSGVSVLWQTTETCVSQIQWGKYPDAMCDLVTVVESGSDTDEHMHVFPIPGMEPEARYYYLVHENDAVHAGDFIAPPAADATKIRLLAIGDTASWIATHAEVYAAMLATINEEPEYQSFMMHMGDIVGDAKGGLFSEDDWDNDIFDDNYRPQFDLMTRVPWALTRGNHDVTDADAGLSLPMRKYWPQGYADPVGFYHSFDYGPIHITVVDMYVDYDVDSAQYAWLVNDLQATDKPWKFMTWHEPAYTDIGGVHGNNPAARFVLHPLCVEHGVQLVMCGHHHSYIRCSKEGIQHVTTAGGGGLLYELIGEAGDGSVLEAEEQCYHFSRISIDGNFLTFSAVRTDGTIIETFVLERTGEAPSNTAPVAVLDTSSSQEAETISGNVLDNDSDDEGDTLTVTEVNGQSVSVGVSVAGSTGGTFTVQTDGSYIFAAGTDFTSLGVGVTASSSITYTVSDPDGLTDTAQLTVLVTGDNEAPIAANDFGVTSRTSTAIGNVLTNDTDADASDTLTVAAVDGSPENVGVPTLGSNGGTFTINTDGSYTLDPGTDFDDLATDTTRNTAMVYTITDGTDSTQTAGLTITVSSTNAAPSIADDTATVPANTETELNVLANDSDPDGDTLTIISVTQGAHGTVINNSTTITYIPTTNYSGTDSFMYSASDGEGHTENATVTVTVEAAPNVAPTANDDSMTILENEPGTITVLENDSDANGDPITIIAVTQGTNGSVTHDNTSCTYTPATDFFGSDSFTYTISDGQGETDSATVTMTITEASNPPAENYTDPAGPINRVAVCTDAMWDSPHFAGKADATERDAYYSTQFDTIYKWQNSARNITASGDNVCEVVELLSADLYTESTVIENWTTDATHIILIRAIGEARNVVGTGSLDPNAAVFAAPDGATPIILKCVTPLYIHMDGLQVETILDTGIGACISCEGAIGVAEIVNCYLDSSSTAYYGGGVDITSSEGTVVIGNTVVNGGAQGLTLRSAGASLKVFNSLVTGLSSDSIESDGFDVSVYNTVLFNNGDDFQDAFTVVSNCASDDNDEGVNSVALNENSSNEWDISFMNCTAKDFRIKDTNSLLYLAGMDVSDLHTDLLGQGIATKDILGATRTGWDIGPFQA